MGMRKREGVASRKKAPRPGKGGRGMHAEEGKGSVFLSKNKKPVHELSTVGRSRTREKWGVSQGGGGEAITSHSLR